MTRREYMLLDLIAALWATLVGVYLLVASTRDTSFAVITSIPPSTFEVVKDKLIEYASIVAVTGFNSALGLFIPSLLAVCALAIPKYRRVAHLITGGLTLAICLVWPFSIGILYLPTALLLLFAAARTKAHLAQSTCFALVTAISASALQAQVTELPPPSGHASIGVRSFHWIDSSRAEPMTTRLDDRREVAAFLWYAGRSDTASNAPLVQSYAVALDQCTRAGSRARTSTGRAPQGYPRLHAGLLRLVGAMR